MYWKYTQLTYPTWTFVYDCIFASKIDRTSPDFGESADSRAELQGLRGNLHREVIIYKCPGGASSPTHVLLNPHTHTGMGLPVEGTNPEKPLNQLCPQTRRPVQDIFWDLAEGVRWGWGAVRYVAYGCSNIPQPLERISVHCR